MCYNDYRWCTLNSFGEVLENVDLKDYNTYKVKCIINMKEWFILGKYYICEKKKLISDGKKMKVLVLKPTKNKKPKEKTPCILWIHGGGYRTGMAEMIYMSRAFIITR